MKGTCRYPEHHRGGGGFPWGLLVVAGAVVLLGTSTAFASDMHDVMYIVLGLCLFVAVAGLGGMALVMHHRRALVRASVQPVLHTYARVVPGMPQAPRRASLGSPGAQPAIAVVPGETRQALSALEGRRRDA